MQPVMWARGDPLAGCLRGETTAGRQAGYAERQDILDSLIPSLYPLCLANVGLCTYVRIYDQWSAGVRLRYIIALADRVLERRD